MIDPETAPESASAEHALEMLGLRWRSGKFLALAGDASFGLHLDAGRIIFATSTQRSLRLGHLLLQLGAVRPSFLDQILQGARLLQDAHALGRVLVREGAISRADLAAGVEEQCIEILARMMEVPTATFLHVNDDPLPGEIEIVPLETDRVLQAAAIRADTRAAVRAMQLILPRRDQMLSLAPAFNPSTRRLTEPERIVALGIERGINTLMSLCSTLPLDPLNVKRAVISLRERGWLLVEPRTL